MGYSKEHEETIETIVNRLLQKGRKGTIEANLIYIDSEGRDLGEMDICYSENINGVNHITYYEIKTGKTGDRRKARIQANRFYNTFRELCIPRFVYIGTTRKQTQYWRASRFLADYQPYDGKLKANHSVNEVSNETYHGTSQS